MSKSNRNHTLRIEDGEAELLRKMVTSFEEVRKEECDDKIICGDTLQTLANIPDNYYDLIIVDPPYNLSRNFHGTQFHRTDNDEYEKYLETWIETVCRKLNSHGTLYMCGDWRSSGSMQRVLSRHLTILNRITWQREKGRGAKQNWKNSMEDIWFAVKNPKDYFFDIDAVMVKRRVLAPYKENGIPKDWESTEEGKYRMTHPSNFWDDISIPFWSMPENTDHPTQKAEKLYAKLILASSKPGDRILDPFAGSGTAAVVAKKLQRHFTTIEINPCYCLWTAKRLLLAEEDSSIQGYSDGVFWERNSFLSRNSKRGKERRKQSKED